MKTSLLMAMSVVVCLSAFGAGTDKSAAAKIKMPLPKGVKILRVGAKMKLKTLEDALDCVRDIRKTDTKTPLALRVAPGDYAPARPLVITKEHAATNFAPLIVYAADFAQKPRIHGGMPITRWKKTTFNGRDDVWVADVSDMSLPKRPRLLFFKGKRMQAARFPNLDRMQPYTTGYAFARPPKDKDEKFYENEIMMATNDVRRWKHPEDGWATINPEHNYWICFFDVAALSNNVIHLNAKHTELVGYNRWDRYCIENIAEELDQPGEWYFDVRAKKVYIIPPNAENPNKVVVAIPRPQPIVTIKGAGNCAFAGLELTGGNDGFRIRGGDGVHILGCSIHDIGFYGFGDCHFAVGVFVMARNSRVADCDIHNIGNHGIMVHGYNCTNPGDRQNVVIENNYIHHCGEVDPAGQGVRNTGQGVRVSHNLMHDFPRSAISGYGRFSETSYNRIRHVNMTADDTGALYDAAWTCCVGSKICYNWISDSIGYKRTGNGKYRLYQGACGIYMDECSGGLEVYGNLIERAHWAAMHLHNAGRWSTISNNLFISNGKKPLNMYTHQFSIQTWEKKSFTGKRRDYYSREYHNLMKRDPAWRKHPALAQDPATDEVFSSDDTMIMGLKMVNNIFYYPDQGWSGAAMNIPKLNMTTNTINRNVYWHGARKGYPWYTWMNGWSKSLKWDAWQATGADADSVVADPLFRDPAKGDYRLKPESPALKLGFKDLPFEKMGLKITRFRPVLPKEAEGLREHPEWLKAPKKPTSK